MLNKNHAKSSRSFGSNGIFTDETATQSQLYMHHQSNYLKVEEPCLMFNNNGINQTSLIANSNNLSQKNSYQNLTGKPNNSFLKP